MIFMRERTAARFMGKGVYHMLPETIITRDEEIRCLQEQGFSEDQVALILRSRDDYTTGQYKDEPPEQRRLEFLRWLYTNGKIEN